MWNSSSSSLHKQILNEGVLSLPSLRLPSALNVDPGFTESTLKYIQLRIQNPNSYQRKMSIIMDEVYTSKTCEFVNGQFRGIELGSDNPTKTILSVMISSLTSNISEIVAMVPLNKLDSSKMKKLFTLVVHQLFEIDLDPVCWLDDGHPTNRKFYRELCGGNLEVSILTLLTYCHSFF